MSDTSTDMDSHPESLSAPVLSIRDLNVSFQADGPWLPAVQNLNLDIQKGEVLGLVGESGCGKSATALAVMGLGSGNSKVTGSIKLNGNEMLGRPDSEVRKLRGSQVAMVFQDPMTSLNPSKRIGAQVVEALTIHGNWTQAAAKKEAITLLDVVGINDPENAFDQYPHEFSGGMRQRVVIAIAMANKPSLIIADEATTALDVTVQAQVLDALDAARKHTGAALLLITHDLGVVAGRADRVAVMYAGRICEIGSTRDVFYRSRMPYTRGLLAATPRIDVRVQYLPAIPGVAPSLSNQRRTGCSFVDRCEFATEVCSEQSPALLSVTDQHEAACHYARDEKRLPPFQMVTDVEESVADTASDTQPHSESALRVVDITKTYMAKSRLKAGRKQVHAVAGVSFELFAGETLGLVGESGCGKSTLSKSIVRLVEPTSGEVWLGDQDLTRAKPRKLKRLRRKVQMVFQDPGSSLDPRMTIYESVSEPLAIIGRSTESKRRKVSELIASVGMGDDVVDRYPHEFSGGQRQRVAIARALASDPSVLILDEPVSALDVSVQATIINLLRDLVLEGNRAHLFIAHDLSVVRTVCERVAVMYLGRIVEEGPNDVVFTQPMHPYTQLLMSSVPIPDPDVERARQRITIKGEIAASSADVEGCVFRARCPVYNNMLTDQQRVACDTTDPQLEKKVSGASAACHYPRAMDEVVAASSAEAGASL